MRIRSLRQEFVFPVEVIKKNVQGADGREKKTADKASVCEFSRLRLKQEFTDEGDFSVNSGLLKKTENLRARYPEDIAVRLWRTEQLFKAGRKDAYTAALAEIGDPVLRCRDYKTGTLLLLSVFRAVKSSLLLKKKAALARYIRKLLNENRKTDGWLLNL